VNNLIVLVTIFLSCFQPTRSCYCRQEGYVFYPRLFSC